MDEAELAFVATMRDEATRQARAARAELDKLGGDTRSINVPVDVKTNVARAKAELKSLEAQIRKSDLGMEIDPKVTKAARVRIADLKRELASLDTTATVNVRTRGNETLAEASRGVSSLLTGIVVLGPAALPILAALTVATGGLGAGLLAAVGAGGALALAIAPVVKGMVEGQKEVTKLSDKLGEQKQALDDARTATDATAKGSKAYKDALKKQQKAGEDYRTTLRDLKRAQKGFSEEYGPAAKGLEQMQSAWKSFKAQTRTSSLGVIGASLKLVADLLPKVAPLANAAAGGVRELVGEFRRWARGPELAQILYFFKTEGPGMIVTWGHIVGNVVLGIVNLFRGFAPAMNSVTGGLEGMTARFREWSSTLDQNQGFQEFLAYAQSSLPQVGRLLGTLVQLGVKLAQAFSPFSGSTLAIVTGIVNMLGKLPTPVVSALGLAVGAVTLALKAYQFGVFATTNATRVATVATTAWAAAQRMVAIATTTTAGRLAGVGVGLYGVQRASNATSKSMGALGGAASGAMAGAALGSFFPGAGTAVGAVVGGLAGMTVGLLHAGKAAKQSAADAQASVGSWEGYAATLDQVTGATTRATRAEALHDLTQGKILPKLAQYGITSRQAVDAVVNGGRARDLLISKMGVEGRAYDANVLKAQKYLDTVKRTKQLDTLSGPGDRSAKGAAADLAALNSAQKRLDAAKAAVKAHDADSAAIKRQLGLATKGIAKGREELAVTRTFTKALKTLPKGVQTRVEAKILRPHEIVDLVARYKKMQNVKKISTLISENGGTPTQKKVEAILAKAKALSKQRAEAKLEAKDHASPVIGRVRANLDHLNGHTATTYIDTVRRARTAGARASGGPIAAQKAYLVGERGPELVTFDRAGYVHDAVATARMVGSIEARARGGKVKGRGKHKGPSPAATLAAQRRAVLRGMPGAFEAKSLEQVTSAQSALNDRLDAYYKKRIKNAAAAKRASAAAKKAIADETAAIKANARARDAVVAKIQAAKEAGAAAKSTALQQGDVTSIAAVNDAPMTAGFIVQGLQQRVADQAKFIAQLRDLEHRGVDKTLIADLRQKGVDAAGSYVSALAGATSEQLSAVNKAQSEIRAQASKIGADTTAGLAVGLSSQLKAIDRAGVRLATALLRAVRRRLGIHSPSTELASDGVNSVAGLIGALKAETPAAEAQAAALAARVQAAATPSLSNLVALANTASGISATPLAHVSETIVIRHEITSPDGSVSKLTLAELADLLERDSNMTSRIERAFARVRARKRSNTVAPSR